MGDKQMGFEVWFKRDSKLKSVVYFAKNAEEARQCFYREFGFYRIISVLFAL